MRASVHGTRSRLAASWRASHPPALEQWSSSTCERRRRSHSVERRRRCHSVVGRGIEKGVMRNERERSWLAERILPGGDEPDPRFTLANERTFLAWIRTSLAFLAGGIALEAFAVQVFPGPLRTWVAVFVICVGLFIAVGAAVRWTRIERSMRHSRPLPVPAIIPLLSLGAGLAAAAAIVLLLVE